MTIDLTLPRRAIDSFVQDERTFRIGLDDFEFDSFGRVEQLLHARDDRVAATDPLRTLTPANRTVLANERYQLVNIVSCPRLAEIDDHFDVLVFLRCCCRCKRSRRHDGSATPCKAGYEHAPARHLL